MARDAMTIAGGHPDRPAANDNVNPESEKLGTLKA